MEVFITVNLSFRTLCMFWTQVICLLVNTFPENQKLQVFLLMKLPIIKITHFELDAVTKGEFEMFSLEK